MALFVYPKFTDVILRDLEAVNKSLITMVL